MGDSDLEDYHYFGTPIEDDYEVRAATYKKEHGKDAATTRQLPLWKQVCVIYNQRGAGLSEFQSDHNL
jgi:hypothetical protein